MNYFTSAQNCACRSMNSFELEFLSVGVYFQFLTFIEDSTENVVSSVNVMKKHVRELHGWTLLST